MIENGIDCARFKPDHEAKRRLAARLGFDPGRPLVVTAARVDPMKDYETYLGMLDRAPEIQAIAVGKGTEQLPDRSNLIAPGSWRDMPELFAAADLVISSSAYGEGFSNAIAEAMACATPAVATDVGDAARIVGDTGLVVPPRDPDAMAAAATSLLGESVAARGARGEAARARIEHRFSLARTVAAFDRLHKCGESPLCAD